jgi:hypothetical protein
LSVHDGGVSEAGKWFGLSLLPNVDSPFRLDKTQLVIDTAGVADFATAWVPNYDENGKPVPAKYCTTAGTRITCDLGTRRRTPRRPPPRSGGRSCSRPGSGIRPQTRTASALIVAGRADLHRTRCAPRRPIRTIS